MDRKEIKKDFLIDAGVFLLFIFTMVFNLMHSSLWGDEWIEYTYSKASILNGDIFRNVAGTFQPPLYNVIMHFYLMINDSVLWFRLFNVFVGTGIGIIIYKTLVKMFNKWVARITLAILSLCFIWVYYVQECSEYLLMIFFLTLAIYFYVISQEKFSYKKLAGFVLSVTGAFYSQYGSFFVIVPLALLYIISVFKSDKTNSSQKNIAVVSYVAALGFFAAPLYMVFVQNQMKHNEIGSKIVQINTDLISDIHLVPGRLIGYFFDVKFLKESVIPAGLITIFAIGLSIIFIRNKERNWTSKSLVICLWITYIIHFVLVKFQIYAMVNPTLSAGFYDRYSLFYIPLFCVTIPIFVRETISLIPKKFSKASIILITLLTLVILSFSVRSIIPNWNKAMDKEYANIWLKKQGWEDTTYLFGTAQYGFEYYVTHNDSFEEGMLSRATNKCDLDNLPDRFWCWRTNWDGEGWQELVDKASEEGYNVIIYDNQGYVGQLAYCSQTN